ncbi:MAG: endolytic transglycosylase MltG [Bryobacterales bacterium]|nr:endolytic transglycosylase MltG [Bryobacterales bacterium]
MKRANRFLRSVIFLLVLALAAGTFAVFTWRQLGTPYQGFGEKAVFLEVERGMSSGRIAERLAEAGVIAHPWQFLLLRYLRPGATLQAGEYRFTGAASARTVFSRLARGDVYYVTLVIPEGANLFEIAALVDASDLRNAKDFLKHARDPSLVRDLDPEAPSLEGYLFPSTYQFRRGITSAEICARLTGEFRRQWKALGAPTGAHRMVTLASLVEKETSIAEERPVVASVYWNRLHEGMRLDCDPTVIYAALLEGKYRGAIYRSDLERDSPYNTYRRAGLPPGPIANPGAAALRAAIHPAETAFLFFVAKGDGSGAHRFSENLTGHTANVNDYRKAVKASGAGTR